MKKHRFTAALSAVMLGMAVTAGNVSLAMVPAYANTDNLPADQQGGPNVFPDGYEPDEITPSNEEEPSSSIDNPILDPEKSDTNNSEITAVAEVPDGFEPDVYIQIQNQTTRDVYQITIPNEKSYRGDAWVPAGDYTVLFAGVPEDTTNQFPFDLPNPSYFTAEEDGNKTLTVRLSNYDEVYDMLHSKEPEPEEPDDTSSEEEKKPSDLVVVPSILPWRTVSKTGGESTGSDQIIEMSYDPNVLVQDTYSGIIKISHSGGIGTGKFKMSLDGGKSWSKEIGLTSDYTIKIAVDGKPFDTGVHLHFDESEYLIGTTYSFSTLKEWQVQHQGDGTGIVYFGGVPKHDVAAVIKIVNGGVPGKATYQYSEDGGKTWNDEAVLPQNGTITTDSEGLTCRLTNGVYVEGDTYKCQITGVPDKDYTTIILLGVGGTVAVLVGGILFYLNSKKAKADTYQLLR